MKLYRGLKNSEYMEFDNNLKNRLDDAWGKILKIREMGGLNYPETMNKEILELSKIQNLARQHFTDNVDIALNYAKTEKGSLIEIDLNIKEILKYFTLEFQNFFLRKSSFEIIYTINSTELFNNSKKWNLKIRKFN